MIPYVVLFVSRKSHTVSHNMAAFGVYGVRFTEALPTLLTTEM